MLKKILKCIDQLQIAIFNCLIKQDYLEQRDQYEQKIHAARIKLFAALQVMRQRNADSALLEKLANLYEIIFSLNNLKLRVKDHATFAVCERDLKKFSQAFSQGAVHVMDEAIESFTRLYESTLMIVSNDPVVFLFFLQDLRALPAALAAVRS